MSYQINKTNGSLLVNLTDGNLDKNTTNLVLVGRNYTGFGEFINENFVKLLENFSNTAAPSNPLEGQLWWDASEKKIKAYNGTDWKSLGIAYAPSAQINKSDGDIWFDRLTKQLFAYDGSNTILIGPIYSATQEKSGFDVATISSFQGPVTVLKLYVANELVAVISNREFTPVESQRIQQLVNTQSNPSGVVYKGINVASSSFDFIGTAENARKLLDSNGVGRTANQFLSSVSNSSTTGTLTIRNNGGLRIGPNSNVIMNLVGNRFDINNQNVNQNFAVKVRNNTGTTLDALFVNSAAGNVGVYTNAPTHTLDVNGNHRVRGNLQIDGNLTVSGDTVKLDVATLNVEDKTIELSMVNGAAASGDSGVDAGGIILRSTDSNKTFLWNIGTAAWTSNQHINLNNGLAYKINGVDKLTASSLVNVTSAPDLTTIGKLSILEVDDIQLNSNAISSTEDIVLSSTENVILNAGTTITIANSKRITNLGDPIDAQDAANKRFVDQSIQALPDAFALDITGLGTGSTLISAVASILTNLIPPTSSNTNKTITILAVSYTGASVTGVNVEAIKNITFTAVDSNGTQNATVVQNVTFNPLGATGTVVLTPTRTYMRYRSNGTVWNHLTTTPF